MRKSKWLRDFVVGSTLLVASSAFAANYTTVNSGNWNDGTAPGPWGGAGVPGAGDTVTITSNHVVTVTDARLIETVTLAGVAGTKALQIDTGGQLTIQSISPSALNLSGGGATTDNRVSINGGTLIVTTGGVAITAGASSVSMIEYTSLGGTVRVGGSVTFGASLGQIDFGPTSGSLEIGGDIDAGTLVTSGNTSNTVTFNGTGPQTIAGGYTYHHLTVNKSGGIASIVAPISVNGDLTLTQGTFDLGSNTLTLKGNFANNGTFNGTSGTVVLTSTALPPSWGGSSITTLSTLTSQNTVDVTFVQDVNVTTLNLQSSGNLTVIPGKKISILPGGAIARTGTTFVIGALERALDEDVTQTYPVGTAAGYAPVDVFIPGGVAARRGLTTHAIGSLTIEAVAGAHPNATGPNVLSRYWTLSNPTIITADLTFYYNVPDITGTETSYILARHITSWQPFGAVDNVNHKAIQTGVTGLAGDWTAGEPASVAPPSILTVTTLLDSGPGSLREAITTVNGGGCMSPCTIQFGINGTGNIVLASPLPPLTANAANLTIDGFSGQFAQPNTAAFGAPSNANITVSLEGQTSVPTGLQIQTNNVTVKGLGFRNFWDGGFGGTAIWIAGGAGNNISGCYIGTLNNGTTAAANNVGVYITGATAANNVIGGTTPDSLNVISGNWTMGVQLSSGANNNSITWNYVGVTADATAALANGNIGVYVEPGCIDNFIGTATGPNIISGNGVQGVRLFGVDNSVKGNYIGLNGAGGAAIPNGVGVYVDGDDNYIGGAGSDRNYISGNLTSGIEIVSNLNAVSNNYIGVDVSGASPVANGADGILLSSSAADNKIGFPFGNLIAHNVGKGINLSTTGIGNAVQKNAIHSNGVMAVDLGDDGPTANDPTDTDTGAANNLQNFPTISGVAINGPNIDVTVSIDSSAGVSVGGFIIDVYEADGSTPRQAASYMGQSACIAGSVLTNQVVSVPDPGLSSGDRVVVNATAYTDGTCTTVSEGTSELSPAGVIPGSPADVAITGIFDSPNDITLGTGNVQYVINTFNFSGTSATAVELIATLPTSSTYVSATPTGAGGLCGHNAGVVTCNWPSQGAGASFSATIVVTPTVAGTNTLSATISSAGTDPVPGNNSDSENTTVNDQIDLAVSSISDSPNDITLGTGNVQYFISLFNWSTSKATNASLLITLPTSSTFVSATPTGAGGLCGAPVGMNVTCTWPDYPAGSSFSVTVIVTPGAVGTNTLSATISADQPDPDNVTAGHLNSDSENTTVNDQIDLAVSSISDSPNDITLGTGNVQYFISLFNWSTSKATNASLLITLPTSSTFVSATPTGAGGLCGAPVGMNVTCTWPDYPAGSSFSVTVILTPGAVGTNTLSATISADQPDPDNVTAGHLNSDSENTTVNDQIDLAVSSISDSPNDITLGTGNVQYFISLFNWSTSKATNASLLITLPTSSTFVSATPTGAGGLCGAPVGMNVTCTWPDYPAGSSFSVTVTVTPGAPGVNTLSATISADQPDPDNVTAGHLNSDSENTTVNDQIDLAVSSISDSPNDITLGTGNVQYFISLFNWSTSKATNASLLITLPTSSTFVSATPTGAGGLCGAPVGMNVTCTWPDYPAGSSFSVTVIVTPGAVGTNTLSATISADQPDPDNITAGHLNSDSENTTVNDQIDLAVSSISDSPNDITLGTGNVQYFISLFNWSTSKATNASLLITLPTSSTFVSATPTGAGGVCSGTGPVTCTWPDYPAGSSFSVTVTVTPGAAGVNTLSATISATQPDPDNVTAGHLNSDSENTTVNDQIDLAVSSISDSPDPRLLGAGNVQYFISLFNWSTSKATNASLLITLPASSTFVSATPTGAGGLCGGTGPVTCTWPDYPAGSSFSVTVIVTPTGAAGIRTLSATISATQPDPDNVTAGHLDTDNETTTVNPNVVPTITGFNPPSGPVGTAVIIDGSNFTGTSQVRFFNNISAGFSVVDDGTINTTVPAGATTGVISVTNGIGTTSSAASFTVAPAPTISTVAPASGTIGGGTFVTISGTNLSTVTSVTFDGSPATILTTTPNLTVRTPPHALGFVNVVVTSPGGSDTEVSGFQYVSPVCADTGSGVITWFRSENDATDSAGPSNATFTGGYALGKVGQGFDLTAGNIVVSAPDSFALQPLNLTVEGWFKFTDNATPQTLVAKTAGTGSSNSFVIWFDGDELRAAVGSTGALGPELSEPFVPMIGRWYHVLYTFSDVANIHELYIDGQSVNTGANVTTITYDTHPVTIGGEYESEALANFFRGFADEVLLHNRHFSGGAPPLAIYDADTVGHCYPTDPTPLKVTPNIGSTAGGTAVLIEGASLAAPTDLRFGGTAATVNGSTQTTIDATMPARPPGTVTMSVTTAAGPGSLTNAFTYCTPPSVTISGPTAACDSAILDAGPFVSYLWSTGATSQTISVTTSGTYSVTVTDGAGCTGSDSHNITINASPTPTITGPTTACDSAILDAGPFAAYLWSTGATSQTISVTTSGTYSVTVTDGNGCTGNDSHIITINTSPTPTITGPTTACNSAVLDAGPFASYLWSTGATSQTISVTTSGTYSVTVTDGAGCTGSDSHNITINASPTPTITGPTTACDSAILDAGPFAAYLWSTGATSQTISVTTSGTYSVTVTDGNGCTGNDSHIITINTSPTPTITGPTTACNSAVLDAGPFASYLWSTGATTQTISVTTSGTYSVTVTDGAGCTGSDSHNITINASPTPTITGPTTACNSAVLDAGPFAAYLWSTGATSQTISVTTSGTYSVTVTDGNGCTGNDSHIITINTSPTPTITGPTTACNSAVLDAGPFASYLWSTGATSQTISVTTSGTYSVTVTDGAGCTGSDSHIITINTGPTPTITGPTTACDSAVLDAGPFVSYLWSTGATTQTISVTTSGTYSVTVTDGNGCTGSDSHNITINTSPTPTITGPTAVCPGTSVTLDAGIGFTGYLWSNGATTQTITVSPATTTTYNVSVTDGNGCNGSDSHTVTVHPTPTASITPGGATTFCAGGSVTLTANAGSSYLWSNGATTQSVNVTASGTFTVNVTDGNGCSATSSPVSVTVNPSPTVAITGPTSTCAATPVTLDAGSFASYLWSTGATTRTISVSPGSTSTYSVTVTDVNGCSGSDSHTVTVSANPTATITTTPAVCANTTGNSASVPTQAGATYAWTIGNGTITSSTTSPNITYTAGPSGTVALGVTITVGSCTSNGSTNVPINNPPVVNITGPTQSCPSTAFTLDAGGGFSSYLWSNGATSQTIAVAQSLASATYSVTVSNGGCSATDTHTVTLFNTASVAITAPSTASPNESGLVANVPADLAATFTWSISNGTITSATNTNAITFTVGSSGFASLNVSATKNGCTTTGAHFMSIAVPTSADLGVTKTAAATVQAGGTLIYTISVTNHGPDTATDVLVVDTLAPGTTLQSVDGGSLNCFAVLNHVNCMGTAFPGQTSTITITVTAPQQGGPTTNTVEATAVNPDPDPSNNTASATTNVIAGPSACATVPPGLVSPTDGATIPSPQTFSWTSVAGAIEYEVWMTTGTLTTLAGTTAQSSLSLPLTPGTGAWFVIARLGGGCPPLRSAQRTFTASQSSNCGTLVAPQVMSPLGGSNVDSPVNISWTPVPQAIGYRVWAEVNSTAAQDLGTTNGAISLTATLPPGPVVVFVDALFNGCPIARSASVAFNVSRPDPCATRSSASLIAPANDATLTSSSVNLQWNAAINADGYRIWFSIDGATPAVLGTTTNETSLSATFSPGVVVWWVEALYNGCASTESNRFRFTIPLAQVCLPNVPALLAPQNNGTLSNGQATFTWTAVQGAVNYELWLATANGTPALVGSTNTTTLTRTLSPGGYAWFVRVTVDRCPPRDSQTSHFTMLQPSNCPERQRPINISPIEGAELTSPITFLWDAPAGATSFDVFVVRGNESPQLVGSTTSTQLAGVTLATGNLRWFVRAHFGQCPPLDSEERLLAIIPAIGACSTLTGPIITAPGQISSGTPFLIQWTPIVGATSYQLQLAGAADFVGAETITTTATQHQLTRTSTVYARARAIDGSCQPIPGISAYGPTSAIFILPTQGSEGSVPVTEDSLMFTIPIGAEFAGQTFTATTREPWLTVFPASGIVGAGGTLLTVTANTVGLPLGTNLGAVTITLNTPSVGNVQSHGTTITIPTMSVSLVTPVTPSPKSGPPPDALIIPAVAHADGINSKFQSDVRVSNTSPQVLKYLLTFTPSGGTGISSGKQTTFSIEPGRTVALDDVLKSWFGTGTVNSSGTLEIRPLTATATSTSSASLSGLANLVTFAASRTFNLTSNGTFGQFIPAIPFSNFVGRSLDLSKPALISLQQIAQSDRYRTNLGIVEGSGQAVSLLVKVFGDSGLKLTEFPVNLAGGEHTQLNAFLAQHGISSLNDGRVEIEVTSSVGKVTAYASVLDNKTSDPLLVTPVTLTDAGATRWVVPGVADLNNGFANWQTDMRVFNAGTTSVDATVSFYSQGGGAAITKSITIPSGQVLQFDKTLSSLFGVSNDGGAVHITTLNASRLITTARTYNQTTGGTYGQFISAVTPAEAAGVGSRPLQILQVEESNRFRSNIGLAEVTGNPVKIEIAVIPPDAKFTTFTQLTLQPNEFRQIGSLLKTVGLDGTFNARVTVRAIEGTGRVTAYASVIDAITNDPTYVPAQ